ncbi:hypothetical protein J4N45_09730 [Vibrio sp. SCSIO 43140]|uniref:hypothetical protein n=1 Tax=Vibrio sp. SCSIO 43140 TaxID=2819100 RepID=UPI002075BEAD|nr:hypothetical protein [Vibrio sp. SCSIO 43140]USD58810.1 hypothetical protein J4N45_09730 [Vibrio sp. SCSIO 43140]
MKKTSGEMVSLEEFEERMSETTARLIDLNTRFRVHRGHIAYVRHGFNLNLPCFLPPSHVDFELPDKEMVRRVVASITDRGFSKSDICYALGLQTKNNRTLNIWMNDSNPEKQIK